MIIVATPLPFQLLTFPTSWRTFFVEIIRTAAGLVPQTELERQKLMQQALKLKIKYGEYLRAEINNVCAFPGCGKALTVADNGAVRPVCELALIDKKRELKVDNLLALCPMCHATYSIDDSKKLCKDLQGVKKLLVALKQSMKLLDGLPLEKGIVGVISKIKNLKEKPLPAPSLEPKDIREKIDPNEYLFYIGL